MLVSVGCAGLPKHLTKTQRLSQPPEGKALVNFHRPSTWGGAQLLPIMDRNGRMLIDLPGGSEFQYVCDPGEQVFIAWAEHVSVVKANVAAGKIYDIMVDLAPGWIRANIMVNPMTKADPRRPRLPEFERREKQVLALNRNDHVTDFESRNQQRVQQIKTDFLGGQKSQRVRSLAPDDCR